MNNLKMLYLFFALPVLFIGCSMEAVNEPVPVIFDSDIGNDIDDVLALQMLINYDKEDEIDLLGITLSKAYPRSIDYTDAYTRLYDLEDIPLGYVYDGVNPEKHRYVPKTLDTIVNGEKVLEPSRSIGNNIPEGYKLIRKLLASQKDNSVTLIVVGPGTNIARLLNSSPDEFSSLNGVELVEKKVRLLSIMGGLYNDDYDFPEWNIIQDLEASQIIFDKWPGQIIASGYEVGMKLLYPHERILNDFNNDNHPLPISYKVYEKMPYDRPTWDLTSVLHAIEPEKNYFELSEPGTIKIDSTGWSNFTESQNGKHRFLKIEEENRENTLEALVNQVAGNK